MDFRPLAVRNVGSNDLAATTFAEITGVDDDGTLQIDAPTAGTTSIVVLQDAAIPAGARGTGHVTFPCRVRCGETVAAGDTVGTNTTGFADSGQTGFVALGVAHNGYAIVTRDHSVFTLGVKEVDGAPDVSSVTTVRFHQDDFTVTDDGSGQVTITAVASPTPTITLREQDGTPSTGVSTIEIHQDHGLEINGTDQIRGKDADASTKGMVTTTAQTFGGAKTFEDEVTCEDTLTCEASSAIDLSGAAQSATHDIRSVISGTQRVVQRFEDDAFSTNGRWWVGVYDVATGATQQNHLTLNPGALSTGVDFDALSGDITGDNLIALSDLTVGNLSTGVVESDSNGLLSILSPSSAYTPSNVTTDRTYDADSTSVEELADVLGTLIADLQTANILG